MNLPQRESLKSMAEEFSEEKNSLETLRVQRNPGFFNTSTKYESQYEETLRKYTTIKHNLEKVLNVRNLSLKEILQAEGINPRENGLYELEASITDEQPEIEFEKILDYAYGGLEA